MTLTLKLATSLDGRIATAAGESRWITGPDARAQVHRLRASHDAVVVGIGTALTDDPELTARTDPTPARQPARVVLDSQLRLPPAGRLAQTTALGRVIVVTTAASSAEKAAALEACGVAVLRTAPGSPRLDLAAAVALLGEHGLARLFLEGGGAVAASALSAGLVDVLHWFRAPILLGAEGVPAVGPLALDRLAAAPRFVRERVEAIGPDLWEIYRRA